MCTAATYKTKDFYFGRTLDYEFSYGHSIAITPRNYPFEFRNVDPMPEHYALIGIAFVVDGYPLYYDAANEKGLGMAGLNFVGNAHYFDLIEGKQNVASFEFIPYILGQCESVEDAKKLLANMSISNVSFKEDLPDSSLHWIISDETQSITVESVAEGLMVYDNPVGCLTNNPPFDKQLFQLNNYMALSAKPPVNNFAPELKFDRYSRGMGAIGLPGDLSSESRFARVAFTKMNSVSGDSELESVSQFFHILGSVDQARGCCNLGDDSYEITLYTSCINTNKGLLYYNSYDNHQISCVDMNKEDLDSKTVITYELVKEEQINRQN